MNFSIRNGILCSLIVALLIPSTLRVGGITVFDIFFEGLFALYTLNWISHPRSNVVKKTGIVGNSMYLLLLLSFFSYIFNYNYFDDKKAFVESLDMSSEFLFARLSVYGIMTLLMLILVYKILSTQRGSDKFVKKSINILLIAGGVNALITICYWLIATRGVFDRYNFVPPLEGSQGIHNYYMNIVFLISFALWLHNAASRNMQYVVVSLMIICGFSTLTVMVRQSWVMFILSIIIFLILSWRYLNWHAKRRGILFILLCIVIGGYLSLNDVYQTIIREQFAELSTELDNYDGQGSILARIELIKHGINVFMEHPILGVGFGHYPAYSSVPVFVSGVPKFVASPHNGVVTVMAEMGIIGLIIYSSLCTGLVVNCKKAIKASENMTEVAISCAVYSLLIVALLAQFTANTIILPLPTERSVTQISFVFWFLLGLAAAVGNRRN